MQTTTPSFTTQSSSTNDQLMSSYLKTPGAITAYCNRQHWVQTVHLASCAARLLTSSCLLALHAVCLSIHPSIHPFMTIYPSTHLYDNLHHALQLQFLLGLTKRVNAIQSISVQALEMVASLMPYMSTVQQAASLVRVCFYCANLIS